jgi:hypothetical protein
VSKRLDHTIQFQHSEQTEGFCYFIRDRRAKQRISFLTWILFRLWLQTWLNARPSICRDIARHCLADSYRRFGIDIVTDRH